MHHTCRHHVHHMCATQTIQYGVGTYAFRFNIDCKGMNPPFWRSRWERINVFLSEGGGRSRERREGHEGKWGSGGTNGGKREERGGGHGQMDEN